MKKHREFLPQAPRKACGGNYGANKYLFATRAGLGRLLFDSARAWTGHYRGRLAISTIFGSAAFGSICGSSIATGATMASVALPEMKRHKYSSGLATGLVAIASGRLKWAAFASCLLETAKSTGMIFLILVSAQILNSFLALSQVTTELANALSGSGLSPILILVGILLIYLVLGCVMDSLAMILLTVPVFFPLLIGLDFGYTEEQIAIWFGVLALFAVEIGLITPPIGLNVYVINSLDGETPLGESFRGVVPCLLSGLVVLALILSIPALCLWLPGLQ